MDTRIYVDVEGGVLESVVDVAGNGSLGAAVELSAGSIRRGGFVTRIKGAATLTGAVLEALPVMDSNTTGLWSVELPAGFVARNVGVSVIQVNRRRNATRFQGGPQANPAYAGHLRISNLTAPDGTSFNFALGTTVGYNPLITFSNMNDTISCKFDNETCQSASACLSNEYHSGVCSLSENSVCLACAVCDPGVVVQDCGVDGPGTCPPQVAAADDPVAASMIAGISAGAFLILLLLLLLLLVNRRRSKPVEDAYDVRDYWWGIEEAVEVLPRELSAPAPKRFLARRISSGTGFTAVFDWQPRKVLHPGFDDYGMLPEIVEADYLPQHNDEYFDVDDKDDLDTRDSLAFEDADFEIMSEPEMEDPEVGNTPARGGPALLDSFGFQLTSFAPQADSPTKNIEETVFTFNKRPSVTRKRSGYLDVQVDDVKVANHPGVKLRTAAAKDDTQEMMEVLRQHENQPGLIQGDDQTSELPPLHIAAGMSAKSAIVFLLEQGASPNQTSARFQNTPLHVAAERGDAATVKLLLDNGADPKMKDKAGFLPLHVACDRGDLEIIALLLEAHPEAGHNSRNEQLWSPLHLAARADHEAAALKLLDDPGRQADAADARDRTPLHWAAAVGNMSLVKALVEQGRAHVDPLDADYATPESVARRFDNKEVAAYLAQAAYEAEQRAAAAALQPAEPADFVARSTYYAPPAFALESGDEVEVLLPTVSDKVTGGSYYSPPAFTTDATDEVSEEDELVDESFDEVPYVDAPVDSTPGVVVNDEPHYAQTDEPYYSQPDGPPSTQTQTEDYYSVARPTAAEEAVPVLSTFREHVDDYESPQDALSRVPSQPQYEVSDSEDEDAPTAAELASMYVSPDEIKQNKEHQRRESEKRDGGVQEPEPVQDDKPQSAVDDNQQVEDEDLQLLDEDNEPIVDEEFQILDDNEFEILDDDLDDSVVEADQVALDEILSKSSKPDQQPTTVDGLADEASSMFALLQADSKAATLDRLAEMQPDSQPRPASTEPQERQIGRVVIPDLSSHDDGPHTNDVGKLQIPSAFH
eukprot:TRINITY_DN11279_c0_g1_i1.p1 TRINITY_DN11279_c0_g1~~TRINITY_DN11279_c0_g1_i1.p1  ORF type:complete len:1070 (+),score=264.18 TRINITY_DN11279_c0_g1_i1:86-3211(+)